MTAYSSAELAALADHVPVAAADKGLLFVVGAEFNREADVELTGGTVALDSALAICSGRPSSLRLAQRDQVLCGTTSKRHDRRRQQ